MTSAVETVSLITQDLSHKPCWSLAAGRILEYYITVSGAELH
jgi:hypothetical protein